MGSEWSYLAKPVKDKESGDSENEWLKCGYSRMQGWRPKLEDAYNCFLNFDENSSLFGIYDGHGSSVVSTYLSKELSALIKTNPDFKTGDFEKALEKSFIAIDEKLKDKEVANDLLEIKKTSKRKEKEIIENLSNEIQEEKPKCQNIDYDGMEVEEFDLQKLRAEADIPIEDLLAQYKNENVKTETHNGIVVKAETSGSGASSSKSVDGPSSSKSDQPKGSSRSVSASVPPRLIDESDSDDSNDENFLAPDGNIISSSEEEEDEDEEEDESEESEDSDDEIDETVEDKSDENTHKNVANKCGSTALVAICSNGKIFLANAGNSKAVLSRNGIGIDLNKEHVASNPVEAKRVNNSVNFIEDGLVNGLLNVTRAIGYLGLKRNLDPKKQGLISIPEIEKSTAKENDFMIIASDGVWNSITTQKAVNFVKPLLDDGTKLSTICEKLFDDLLSKTHPSQNDSKCGCDNMTCIIVQFKKSGPIEIEENDEEEPTAKRRKIEKNSTEPTTS